MGRERGLETTDGKRTADGHGFPEVDANPGDKPAGKPADHSNAWIMCVNPRQSGVCAWFPG